MRQPANFSNTDLPDVWVDTGPAVTSLDGRRRRGQRSRRAILNAVLSLQNEGILVPTAQQISDRAGVGIRSFFRHFADMEQLFDGVDTYVRNSYQHLFLRYQGGDSLDERARNAAQCYARAYEELEMLQLSASVQSWQSEVVRDNIERAQHLLSNNLRKRIPELESLPQKKRQAADAVVSFEMWHRLRHHQKIDQNTVMSIMQDLLLSLID